MTKNKVTKLVESCHIELDGVPTIMNLNILMFGSYDVFIGIDSIASHRTKLDYCNRSLKCIDDEGEGSVEIQQDDELSENESPSLSGPAGYF